MIDARGLRSPSPVILAKKALDERPSRVEMLVDNQNAARNITHYANAVGYHVEVSGYGANTHLYLLQEA